MPKYSAAHKTNLQLKLWRKRTNSFQTRKKELLEILHKLGFSKETIRVWLNTPLPDLGNRTPKSLVKPHGIGKLILVAKKLVAAPPVV